MAFFTYLDASGTKDTPALAVAGYIAREERWLEFDREWVAALNEFGIPELHMKDFISGRRAFAGWDEPKRRAFIQRVALVMNIYTDKSLSTFLFVNEYHEVNQVFKLRETHGGPYALTAFFVLLDAFMWRHENHPTEHMAHFIEHGDNDQGELLDLLRRRSFFYEPVTPLKKKVVEGSEARYVYPFQACDFLAYEVAKGGKTILEKGGDTAKARGSLMLIGTRERDPMHRYIDKKALIGYCKKTGVSRR